jgi:hypothetical protein
MRGAASFIRVMKRLKSKLSRFKYDYTCRMIVCILKEKSETNPKSMAVPTSTSQWLLNNENIN